MFVARPEQDRESQKRLRGGFVVDGIVSRDQWSRERLKNDGERELYPSSRYGTLSAL